MSNIHLMKNESRPTLLNKYLLEKERGVDKLTPPASHDQQNIHIKYLVQPETRLHNYLEYSVIAYA